MRRSDIQPLAPDFERELIALIPHMRAFARTLCRNRAEADDLAQDALAKALKSRDTYKMGTNMKAWLFMILRNQFYSERRRSWRASPLEPDFAERLLAVDDPDATLALDDVRQALLMLPDEQREALVMIGAGGFSYEEAAEITGIAIGTVKSRVSRARAALHNILERGAIRRDGTPAHEAIAAIIAAVPRR